nr:hypothetical protein GCM10020093_083440 [Planobispora longispora]
MRHDRGAQDPRPQRGPRDRNLALTLAACLLVPLVCAATFDLLSYPAVTALMFLLVGATGALHRATKENPVPVTS